MAVPQKKRLALDTNVVLDLALGAPFAHDFREVCLERGYSLWLPPTAVEELVHFAETEKSSRGALAHSALTNLLAWKIQPFPLDDVDRFLARRFSRTLRDRGLLPDGEDNDGRLLGETAAGQIPMLVTSDSHLLDIDARQLQVAIADSDLSTFVAVAHPGRMLRALRGRR
jgi:predicted nucleic acid-binding protein